MTTRNKYLLILILFSIFSFFALENRVPFSETSDARYCEISYETLTYHHFLIPTQNKIIHITKPPLTYILTALGFKLFGVNEFGGRFFAGLCGLTSSLLVFFISFLLFKDEKTAFLSGVIFSSTPLIIGASRIVTTDIFLLTSMLFSIFYFLRYLENGKIKDIYYFWIWLGISGFIKGPLGYLQIIPIILIYLYATNERDKIKELFKPLPIAISLTIGFWWFIYIFLKIPNSFNYLFDKQLMSRFSKNGFGHPKPIYYYFEILFFAAYPWIFGALFSIKWILNKIKKDHNFLLLSTMFLYPIIFFSLPKSKLSLYILLSLASLSIIIAKILTQKKKCSLFIFSLGFETILIVLGLYKKLIPINALILSLIIFVTILNLIIVFILKNVETKSIFTSLKIVGVLLLSIYITYQKPEKYFFTLKTAANFINKMEKKPENIYLVGFNSRSIILYTKIHPIETRFDKEFIYADPETKKMLIHIDKLKKKWGKDKNSLIIVKNKDAKKYLKEFKNSKIIFKDSRFSVLSH